MIVHLLFMTLFIFQLARPHNDPERVLHRKIVELSSLIRKLDEKNQQLAIRNEEMVRMDIYWRFSEFLCKKLYSILARVRTLWNLTRFN